MFFPWAPRTFLSHAKLNFSYHFVRYGVNQGLFFSKQTHCAEGHILYCSLLYYNVKAPHTLFFEKKKLKKLVF